MTFIAQCFSGEYKKRVQNMKRFSKSKREAQRACFGSLISSNFSRAPDQKLFKKSGFRLTRLICVAWLYES